MARRLVSLSARDIPALRGAALAMKAVDRETRRRINQQTKAHLGPIWGEALRDEVAKRGNRTRDLLVLLDGARVKPGNPASVEAGTSGRPLSGGLIPSRDGGVIEFGAPAREELRTYTRHNSRTGGTHRVTRATKAGLPYRIRNGRVVYPAFSKAMPRLVSLWVQTIVRAINEGLEP